MMKLKFLVTLAVLIFAVSAFGQTALTSTTLSAAVTATADEIYVTSATGISAPSSGASSGSILILGEEAMRVTAVNSTLISVQRGYVGRPTAHAAGETVYEGAPAEFANTEPSGYCTSSDFAYTPLIVMGTGRLWYCHNAQWTQGQATTGYYIGGPSLANLDWSTRGGDLAAYGARLVADFDDVTRLKGSDFRVTANAGDSSPSNLLIGGQNVAITATGLTSVGEVYGTNSVVLYGAGASVNVFGVVGNVAYSSTASGGSLYNAGVYGELDDSTTSGIDDANATTGSIVAIVNNSGAPTTRSTDGAVVAVITAGADTSAFQVQDRNDTLLVDFDFGLDMYGSTGGVAVNFKTADIRGEQGDTIDNGTSGTWNFNADVKATGYKSSDGTDGVTVTTCSGFKDGLCISGS